jgi:uncharacterized protein
MSATKRAAECFARAAAEPREQASDGDLPTKSGGRTSRPERSFGAATNKPRRVRRARSIIHGMARAPTSSSPLLFEIRRSPVAGMGAFATRPIRKGTRLIEYVGKRIRQAEADALYDDDAMEHHHTFLFSVDAKTVIDASVDGNEARFINHSCEPNCEALLEGKRVFIEAIRDIEPGAELFYDYGLERDEPYQESWRELYGCKCSAATCRGTMIRGREEPVKKKPAKKAAAKKPVAKKAVAKEAPSRSRARA